MEQLTTTPSDLVTQDFFKIPRARLSILLATAIGCKPTNIVNGYRFTNGDFKILFDKAKKISPSAHKFYMFLLTKWAKQERLKQYPPQKADNWKPTLSNNPISFTLDEFLEARGLDIKPHDSSKAEKERINNLKKYHRKKVDEYLELLRSSSFSWKEKIRKQRRAYFDVNILDSKGRKGDVITVRISQTFAEYLAQLPVLAYISMAMLAIPETRPNAYALALFMLDHFGMVTNQATGLANRLSVQSLLKATNYPSIEKVKKDRHSWEQFIKEPFEADLDTLVKCGFLEERPDDTPRTIDENPLAEQDEHENCYAWAYRDSKKAASGSFENWESCTVLYHIKDYIDQSAQVAAYRTRAAKAEKLAEKRRVEAMANSILEKEGHFTNAKRAKRKKDATKA